MAIEIVIRYLMIAFFVYKTVFPHTAKPVCNDHL